MQRPAAALPAARGVPGRQLRWYAQPQVMAGLRRRRSGGAAASAAASASAPTTSATLRRRAIVARVASVTGGSSSSSSSSSNNNNTPGPSDDDMQASTDSDGVGAIPSVPLADAATAATATAAAAANANANAATAPPKTPPTSSFARAMDALTRARWYRWYLERLERRPTLTKAVTALCGFVVGDLVAQSLSGGGVGVGVGVGAGGVGIGGALAASWTAWLSHVDWARTARMGAFGFLVDGPVGGAYYAWLDRTIWPDDPLSPRTVLTKTVLDQTVYSALGTVAFFTFIRLLETGGDVSAVAPTLAAKFWPTLAANYTIWPLAHLINFRFVPPPLRVAYNQVVAVGWLTWLSLLAHSRAATAPAVAALAHKAAVGSAAAAASGGGGAAVGIGGWLQSVLSALPHF